MTDFQAAIYPNDAPNPTVAQADAGRKSIAVCFSGGGSRALTCAWGQLLGLSRLKGGNGKSLLDEVRYISSVSGGSWASVLYTFRPGKFSDDAFLGDSYDPSQLYYDQNKPGGLNVSTMGASSLGKIPQNFANIFEKDPLKNIIGEFIAITALKGISLRSSAKWLWMYVVAKNVLADFELYDYRNSILKPWETPWNYKGAKFFSLSRDYAEKNIFSKPDAPSEEDFVYARTISDGRPACPMLIINTNIIANNCPNKTMSEPLQIPTQVSPVASGIYGTNPCSQDRVGGGSVESFAFTSSLASSSGSGKITADFPRKYMLADITASSSAFYAATLADPMQAVVSQLLELGDEGLSTHFSRFVEKGEMLIMHVMRSRLASMKIEAKSMGKASLVPQYNYWPVNEASQGGAANRNTEFTDGGDLENTGVAGLLAQVQGNVDNIIAFVNGSDALEKKNNEIIAATQMAPLFGVAFDEHLCQFKAYLPGGVNPFNGLTDPEGFLQVFDNSRSEFDDLRRGLYSANGSGAMTDPAFFLQKLQIVKNALLGITQTHSVNVLWVQNAPVNRWQDQITDAELQQKIKKGQKLGGIVEFADFPYYNTFLKIYQTEAETNTLAQMWAWCVSNGNSPLSAAISRLFASAD
ncbi:MAG: hypothetical protein ACU84H_01180 [Gammaproteobacteria bacterium]